MKKHLNVLGIVTFLVALAAAVAAVKIGHPIRGGYGFFSGA